MGKNTYEVNQCCYICAQLGFSNYCEKKKGHVDPTKLNTCPEFGLIDFLRV